MSRTHCEHGYRYGKFCGCLLLRTPEGCICPFSSSLLTRKKHQLQIPVDQTKQKKP
jgi:hypothetical protein